MVDGGYLIVERDDGKINEFKTATCGHCSKVIIFRPTLPPPGGWCGMCSKSICDACCDDGRCTPFEARLEAEERQAAQARAFYRSLGLI